MALNQNPETKELDKLKADTINAFSLSKITFLIFFIVALVAKYIFRIHIYREVFFLILGWLAYCYLAQYIFIKGRMSLKKIKMAEFINCITCLLFTTGIFYYMGGILWIGPIFFTFIILYASLLSFPREAFIIVLITFICYSSVIFLQYLGLIPYKEFFKLTPYLYKDSQYVIITILVGGFIFFIFFLTGKNFSQRLKQKNTELAQAKKGLEEWNIKLEEKVRLRTLELIKLNEDLKQDMTKRKKAEERLKKTMNATIETMSKMIEAKDPYTSGHQHRVCQLAVPLAQELGLPEDKIEGIRIASLIHDIGKIGLPAEILSNPSKLNDIEFGLIKNHSQIGYDILKSIDFSYPVAQTVLQHHERLNGSGYPNNLKGDKILLEAKIIGVADVVEAMSSHRPYRPSLGIDKALEEIIQNRGTLYDPEVANACLKLFKEKGFKFK